MSTRIYTKRGLHMNAMIKCTYEQPERPDWYHVLECGPDGNISFAGMRYFDGQRWFSTETKAVPCSVFAWLKQKTDKEPVKTSWHDSLMLGIGAFIGSLIGHVIIALLR